MKKLFIGLMLSCFIGGNLFAMKAVVVCRTSGVIHKSLDTVSMNCGSSSDFDCKRDFENALKNQYNVYDVYDAEKKVCNQLSGNWYPDDIKIRY